MKISFPIKPDNLVSILFTELANQPFVLLLRRPGKVISNALSDKQVKSQMLSRDAKKRSIIGFRGPYGNVFPIEEWKGEKPSFHCRWYCIASDALRYMECIRPS